MSRPIWKLLILTVVVVLVVLLGISAYWVITLQADASEKTGLKAGPIYETEEFTVNMSNTLNHFIKARFALELSDNKALKELEEKMPMMRDKIIMVLSGQSLDTLSTLEGKEDLKRFLIKAINEILETGQVKEIYYQNIIFQ